MKIANIEFKGYAALAPMAGITDRTFRKLCLDNGASYVFTEMISSKGLECDSCKTKNLMTLSENEKNTFIQIFGCDILAMTKAAIEAQNYGCVGIDINMGCPVTKVASHGSGCSLMRTPELAEKIVKSCSNELKIPLTVKIRTGWDDDTLNAVEIAKRVEQAGASAITVHGRTKKQMYAPPINYDVIKEVKRNVSIPVIGNGDVFDVPSAKKMYDYTGCDFIMIGRGALGAPWIFNIINTYYETGIIKSEPSLKEKTEIMLKHITDLCADKGEYVGIREARKHVGWYIKGLKGAAALRNKLSTIESLEELEETADKIVNEFVDFA